MIDREGFVLKFQFVDCRNCSDNLGLIQLFDLLVFRTSTLYLQRIDYSGQGRTDQDQENSTGKS